MSDEIPDVAKFDTVFMDYARESDRPDLALDENGSAVIAIGNDVLVNLFTDAPHGMAFAVATIGVAADDDVTATEVYLKLLTAHSLERNTNGFSIGMESEETGRLVVFDRRPLAFFTDWKILGAWFGVCANNVRKLRGTLGYEKEEISVPMNEEIVIFG